MLSLRHFMILKTVAETENFTKAAEKLYITQSAVSHTIRELEEYTGTVLFDRLSKQVQITAAGKLLLTEVSPILAACESLDKRIRQLESQAPVHIVSSITIAAFWLPRILTDLQQKMPGLPVYVNVVRAAEAIHTLACGNADIAFIEGANPQGPFLCTHFSDYTLKIVCSPTYPLSGTTLSIREFCAEKLLLREQGSAIRDTLESNLYLQGCTVHPTWVSVNSTALLEAAKAGLGITVLPEVLVNEELSKNTLISLEVDGLSLTNNLIAVRHKDKHMTPALKHLLSCISIDTHITNAPM